MSEKQDLMEEGPSLLSIVGNYVNKILFLEFLKDSSSYGFYLFILWILFAGIIYAITFGIKSSQMVYTLYCCDVWIFLLAFLFL
jgi:hypothetical protein